MEVFIAEENIAMLSLIEKMVLQVIDGAIAHKFRTIDDIFAAARINAPELIILSDSVKEIHIIDAVMQMREISPNSKIICLIMPTNEHSIVATTAVGAADFLIKPIKKDQFLRTIKNVLGSDN